MQFWKKLKCCKNNYIAYFQYNIILTSKKISFHLSSICSSGFATFSSLPKQQSERLEYKDLHSLAR